MTAAGRRRVVATAAVLLALTTTPCPALAAAERALRLPSGVDGRQARLVVAAAEAGQFGVLENHAAGPVQVREDVRLEVAPDGALSPVHVLQSLEVPGPGDYVLELPAGAESATARPGSDNEPGLRGGTVLWEGFSAGGERLAADLRLGADEADRLPVSVRTGTSGADLTMEITNTTAIAVRFTDGVPDAGALQGALDAARAAVERGQTPRPGSSGIAEQLAVSGEPQEAEVTASVPVRVRGTVRFGGRLEDVDVVLPSDAAPDGVLRLRGPAPLAPQLDVELLPLTPQEVPVLEAGADAATRRAALRGLVSVLGRGFRRDDYLPVVPGRVETSSVATFTIASAAAAPAPTAPAPAPSVSPVVGLLTLAVLLVSAAGLWSIS